MRLKSRDRRFVLVAGINLLAVTAFLLSHIGDEPAYTGWRKIDYQALVDRINSGDLVRHEAHWYRLE